ncbi:sulfatase [Haloferax mediterranei ATCC 33500]|uniref:Sulfatase n=1 Tax=Haloferax mediterranei (strain ATCC 33500 / DSM 1411 / JCM 8866 / NBRC 14739 / NCIMB 2177 / R-4) TaxID=523841 RepID=I3R0R0_HALMT|nr:sulfatase [Haloferax mediterranei]AFK17820.1 arylsulfatase, choline-sulfatase [Haloferax mediterranei ATCC 33500]AHZ22754.1 sulfatase [Haloferax mediterranei ATCC 33500]EMA02908.1 arylsulfatase, choline-sulfatase [Haloferax mediterranei ATCC 33500]MDX5987908.1 sulfatase [Haloferax mediterranei ATCC 33500]QCQ74381.1 sulfatase [Haloferax mediterranei ATCC 33500]
MTESPENVLFVVMDTVRKDHLTPYGYDRPTTPGLERFAEEATVFEQAVAPAPWTLPVHASLFTGMYPSQHGADQENPYLEGVTTLAETLSAAGYDTACYSSNAWITPYTHLTDGFEQQDNFFEVMPGDFLSGPLAKAWKTMNDSDTLRALADKLVSLGNTAHEYLAGGDGADSKTPTVIDETIDFIDDSEEFFAFINLMDAHLPYHPPEEYKAEFASGVDSTEVCQNSKEYNAGAYEIESDEWEAIRGLYDAEIAHIDDQLTRLFDYLKETDQWDDTMVVVCADHGELHGEHGLYGHEFCLYDPLINVPLIVKHPTLGTGRHEEQVELVDLYHTVLDSLGVEGGEPASPGDNVVGLDRTRSLLSADYRDFAKATNDDPGQRRDGEYAFVEYSRPVVELKQLEEKASGAGIVLPEDSRFYSRMRSARRVDAKYTRIDRIPDEAYRIDTDPEETENLATSDDEAIAETERALSEFEDAIGGAWTDALDTDVSDGSVDQMDDEAQERLRDLGYLE